MHELDDAALELRLRQVLTEHLGSLPLEVTAEGLERRRLARDEARRRRRVLVGLGLAAALVLPAGWLAAGAPLPTPPVPLIALLTPEPTDQAAPTAAPTTDTAKVTTSASPEPGNASPDPGVAGTSRDLLVVTRKLQKVYAAPCDDLDRYDTETGAHSRLLGCADRISISPDATKAAVGGDHGLPIVDLRDGKQIDFIELGEPVFPIAWSPSGRWLQWAACGSEADTSDPCKIAIGSQDDASRNRLPGGEGGGFSVAQWLPDESHVTYPKGGSEGWLIGNGDGSDLKPLATDSALVPFLGSGLPAAVSPDGTRFAYSWGPYVGGHTTVIDLWEAAIDGSERRNLTNFEPGAQVRGAAWSPDGRTIALIKGLPGPDGRLPSSDVVGPNELWLLGEDGSMRHVEAPGDLYGTCNSCTLPIEWSPDGSRFTIEVANGKAGTSIDTIIVPMDGSKPVVLQDARRAEWSRDGKSIAFVGTTGPYAHLDDDPVPPATIDVVNADGSNRRTVAAPTGDLGGFSFIWAAS